MGLCGAAGGHEKWGRAGEGAINKRGLCAVSQTIVFAQSPHAAALPWRRHWKGRIGRGWAGRGRRALVTSDEAGGGPVKGRREGDGRGLRVAACRRAGVKLAGGGKGRLCSASFSLLPTPPSLLPPPPFLLPIDARGRMGRGGSAGSPAPTSTHSEPCGALTCPNPPPSSLPASSASALLHSLSPAPLTYASRVP